MMQISYCCTHWGSENMAPLDFLDKLQLAGYTGLEINLSPERLPDRKFFSKIEQLRTGGFYFIAQQVLDEQHETPAAYTARMLDRLDFLMDFQPDFINAHTGKDYYRFADNCKIIDAADNLAARRNVPILHETHRGRFSFHLPTLLPYLDIFPTMQLTGDFSHWCCVSESLLEGQADLLEAVIPNIGHLHARVGYQHGPQTADPFAPENATTLEKFAGWWQKVLDYDRSRRRFTVTPEAGPPPYMPVAPKTQAPLADQWTINDLMKNHLQRRLQV
jgi:hypothetical protein